MKYKDLINVLRNSPGCCDTESLNERFQKYIKNNKAVNKNEEVSIEPQAEKEPPAEIIVKKTDTKKWL